MFALLKDSLAAASLKARGDRLARQRAVSLLENAITENAPLPSAYSVKQNYSAGGSATPAADPGAAGWAAVGVTAGPRGTPDGLSAADTRDAARRLAAGNPYAKNVLRVLESYVVGAGAALAHRAAAGGADSRLGDETPPPGDGPLRAAWARFWEANGPHVTLSELAVRVWRDGEAFLRFFPRPGDVPAARFVDPERVGPTRERPDSDGILVDPADAVAPVAYLLVDPDTGEHAETVPAAEILHVKAGADDCESRGVSVLAPLIAPLERHAEWLETELTARRVQASVVLWRKVQGGVGGYGDGDSVGGDLAGERAGRRTFAPGSILTTPDTTDLEFLAPKSSFAEASAIGRALLLGAAAGAGLPEFMLTADASNANYASTMAAEGPAVKRFAAEQRFFAAALSRLWAVLADDAAARSVLTAAERAGLRPAFTWADLAHRDRPAERAADVQLVGAGVLSRAELARREGVDPAAMRRELGAEGASQTVPRRSGLTVSFAGSSAPPVGVDATIPICRPADSRPDPFLGEAPDADRPLRSVRRAACVRPHGRGAQRRRGDRVSAGAAGLPGTRGGRGVLADRGRVAGSGPGPGRTAGGGGQRGEPGVGGRRRLQGVRPRPARAAA